MSDQLMISNKLENTNTAMLLKKLVSNDKAFQAQAYEALDYTLLNINADRPENYGDPKIILENELLFDAIPVLVKIAELKEFNELAKYYALNLLCDIYNFASGEDEKKYSPEKTQAIRQTISSKISIYQDLLKHPNQDIQSYAQSLIVLINRAD